jgi:hypothetical protein
MNAVMRDIKRMPAYVISLIQQTGTRDGLQKRKLVIHSELKTKQHVQLLPVVKGRVEVTLN